MIYNYNELNAHGHTQQIIFPSGSFIKSYVNGDVVGCKAVGNSSGLNMCHKIARVSAKGLRPPEFLSTYKFEGGGQVRMFQS